MWTFAESKKLLNSTLYCWHEWLNNGKIMTDYNRTESSLAYQLTHPKYSLQITVLSGRDTPQGRYLPRIRAQEGNKYSCSRTLRIRTEMTHVFREQPTDILWSTVHLTEYDVSQFPEVFVLYQYRIIYVFSLSLYITVLLERNRVTCSWLNKALNRKEL